jgi:hypothetical protein
VKNELKDQLSTESKRTAGAKGSGTRLRLTFYRMGGRAFFVQFPIAAVFNPQ